MVSLIGGLILTAILLKLYFGEIKYTINRIDWSFNYNLIGFGFIILTAKRPEDGEGM
jgi:hypothetical protein